MINFELQHPTSTTNRGPNDRENPTKHTKKLPGTHKTLPVKPKPITNRQIRNCKNPHQNIQRQLQTRLLQPRCRHLWLFSNLNTPPNRNRSQTRRPLRSRIWCPQQRRHLLRDRHRPRDLPIGLQRTVCMAKAPLIIRNKNTLFIIDVVIHLELPMLIQRRPNLRRQMPELHSMKHTSRTIKKPAQQQMETNKQPHWPRKQQPDKNPFFPLTGSPLLKNLFYFIPEIPPTLSLFHLIQSTHQPTLRFENKTSRTSTGKKPQHHKPRNKPHISPHPIQTKKSPGHVRGAHNQGGTRQDEERPGASARCLGNSGCCRLFGKAGNNGMKLRKGVICLNTASQHFDLNMAPYEAVVQHHEPYQQFEQAAFLATGLPHSLLFQALAQPPPHYRHLTI